MREFGPVRILVGNTPDDNAAAEAIKPYLGIARTQLGITKNLMRLGGLDQLSRTTTLSDGTVITSRSVFGQDAVTITPRIVVPSVAQDAVQITRRTRKVGGAEGRSWPVSLFTVFTNLDVPNTVFGLGAYADGHEDSNEDISLATALVPTAEAILQVRTVPRFPEGDTTIAGSIFVVRPSLASPPDEGSGRIFLRASATTFEDITEFFLTGEPYPKIFSNEYATVVYESGGEFEFVRAKLHAPSPLVSYQIVVPETEVPA